MPAVDTSHSQSYKSVTVVKIMATGTQKFMIYMFKGAVKKIFRCSLWASFHNDILAQKSFSLQGLKLPFLGRHEVVTEIFFSRHMQKCGRQKVK